MSSWLLKQRFCSLFLALVSAAAAVVTELIAADVFVASPVIVSASASIPAASAIVGLVCPSALLKSLTIDSESLIEWLDAYSNLFAVLYAKLLNEEDGSLWRMMKRRIG